MTTFSTYFLKIRLGNVEKYVSFHQNSSKCMEQGGYVDRNGS